MTCYDFNKLQAEKKLKKASQENLINPVSLRLSNVYGYSFSREGLISSNVSVYESYELAKSNYNDGLKYPGRINPASLPLSTDIMDWVGDNQEKEKPDDPFYGEIRLPNQDEM